MGKRYIVQDGKQVELNDDSDLVKMIKESETKVPLSFGQVIEYSVGKEVRIGKITGVAKNGHIIVAKLKQATRSGFQFSSDESDAVNKKDIIRRVS